MGGGSGLAQQIVLWGQKISMLGPSLCRTKASNIAKTPLALEKYDAHGNAKYEIMKHIYSLRSREDGG